MSNILSAIIGALATIIAAVILGWLTGWLPSILQSKKNERENKQRDEKHKAEALQIEMARSKNLKDRAQVFRRAIQADPRIAHIQILDMSQPLGINDVYVRVRLHEESRPDFDLGWKKQAVEKQRDPNMLLQEEQADRDRRFSMATDPIVAVRHYKRCVIVGDPGAGKSTLLKYMAIKSAEGHLEARDPSGAIVSLPDLPIHIELNAFATSGYDDLLEFASSVWEIRYRFPQSEALQYMKDELSKGKAIILLDALDETVIGQTEEKSEESYAQTVNTILNLTTRYEQVPFVVTVRKAGYHQRIKLQGFAELEVLDFRFEDIEHFVKQWFSKRQVEQNKNAEDLVIRLRQNPRLQSLAANPLLLSLIAIVYEAQLDLPDRRAELYKQCVDILLTKWDASRNIRRRRVFKPEHKHHLLQEIAWSFHLQGRRYFPEEDLLTLIANFLPAIGLAKTDNKRILEEIANENGFLKEQARGWHGFLHLTLQEYFTAYYANTHQQVNTLLEHRHDPWWEEVLLLYCGQTSDASPLLQYLLIMNTQHPFNPKRWQKSEIILAGNCLSTRPTVRQVDVREEIVRQLLTIVIKVNLDDCRVHIANILANSGTKEIYSFMLQYVAKDSNNYMVRQHFVEALGKREEISVTNDLLALLKSPKIEIRIRQQIASALGRRGRDDPSIAPMLLNILCDPQTPPDLWKTLIRVLSGLQGEAVFIYLKQQLSDPNIDTVTRQHTNNILEWWKTM